VTHGQGVVWNDAGRSGTERCRTVRRGAVWNC